MDKLVDAYDKQAAKLPKDPEEIKKLRQDFINESNGNGEKKSNIHISDEKIKLYAGISEIQELIIKFFDKKKMPFEELHLISRSIFTRSHHPLYYNYNLERAEIERLAKLMFDIIEKPEIQKLFDRKNERQRIYMYCSAKDKETRQDGIKYLAEYIIDKFKIKTVFGTSDDKNDVYWYNGIIYRSGGQSIIKEESETILDDVSNNHIINEVNKKIQRKTRIESTEVDNAPINLICFENGVFDLNSNKFKDHDPDNMFLSYIPLKFDENAKCTNFLKFLHETADKEDINLIQEIFGYCLYKSNKFKKAVIIEGLPDSGKSTLVDVLIAMIGAKNVSATTLQKLCGNLNGTSNLIGKFANIFDDLSNTAIKDIGLFKTMTGGDGLIPAERKFKDEIAFRNYATLIFTCNSIPETHNSDTAFYNRWLLLYFNNQIPKEKMDRDLKSKLIAKKELEGIAFWAIEGLKRLIKQNDFSFTMTTEEVKEYMERSASHIKKFIDDNFEEARGESISKNEFFIAYTNWCKENGIKGVELLGIKALGNRVPKYCDYISHGMDKTGRIKTWTNIKYKEIAKENTDEPEIFNNFGGDQYN